MTVQESRALARAEKKFQQMDSNGHGVLSGSEMQLLADWVWASFHPGGQAMDDDHRIALGRKLKSRVDPGNKTQQATLPCIRKPHLGLYLYCQHS